MYGAALNILASDWFSSESLKTMYADKLKEICKVSKPSAQTSTPAHADLKLRRKMCARCFSISSTIGNNYPIIMYPLHLQHSSQSTTSMTVWWREDEPPEKVISTMLICARTQQEFYQVRMVLCTSHVLNKSDKNRTRFWQRISYPSPTST